MHPKTKYIKEKIDKAGSIEERIKLLEGAYEGETCYLLTCGPSFKENWNDRVRKLLSHKLIVSVKQTYNEAAEIVDFHLLNSWNYQTYNYKEPGPIVLAERANDDPPTPGMHADLMFHIPNPRDFANRLATTFAFDRWLFAKQIHRPWGPGVVYELGIYLLVHLGVKEVVTLGWDLGELNVPYMKHYFEEEPPGSTKSDGILNKPRIRPFEVSDIAESTRALYYWLRSQGIYLYVVSDRSLVDPVVPRISILQDPAQLPKYKTQLVCNGDFSSWQNDMPSYWQTDAKPELIAFASDTNGSSSSLQLKPAAKKKHNSIFQLLKMEPFFKGARLIGSVKARSDDPGKLGFVVACLRNNRDRNPIVFQTMHPGDGNWHNLKIDQTIPAHLPITHLKFMIKLGKGAKKTALVSQIAVNLEK
jgi:hypothetical protein